MQKLQEAQDDYNEVARLCAFRLNFFHKGVKVPEELDPYITIVPDKHQNDCQLIDGPAGEEDEGTDDGELSSNYKLKKPWLATSSNPMEVTL
ncbi:hypothetical protein L1987_65707 [Smallanthus sonchifolius]|uniref:Uncharacterized protein n=1 Tax=Smallanthus sonchifolius TaxID=185202 RepID=A0ACB9BV27_9ASTR|nr:hypothetical protein L1987_65707 [Smallanthus sonchifolius]